MGWRLAVVAVLCACGARLEPGGSILDNGPDASSGGGSDGSSTASPDAALGAWGPAAPVTGASDPTISQDDCTVNSTQTELYFKKASPAGDTDLYVMTRATSSDPWGTPTQATALDSTASEESPRLWDNDLTIYFGRGGSIFKSTRASVTSPWGTPTAVTPINVSGTYNKWLAVCTNNGVEYFMVSRSAGPNETNQDLFIGTLDGTDTATDSSLSSASSEISAYLSPDCLTAAFASNRSGNTQIYMATRTDPTADFGPAMGPVMDFGTATDNEDLWLSADMRTAVFASIRDGDTNKAVYVSTR
ncbi:MAG TPA: hypothetical protein VMJ10_02150 [Kofleriaceae bacterium]|nr:hypothetical protein [Kofleriaceae bacterium]